MTLERSRELPRSVPACLKRSIFSFLFPPSFSGPFHSNTWFSSPPPNAYMRCRYHRIASTTSAKIPSHPSPQSWAFLSLRASFLDRLRRKTAGQPDLLFFPHGGLEKPLFRVLFRHEGSFLLSRTLKLARTQAAQPPPFDRLLNFFFFHRSPRIRPGGPLTTPVTLIDFPEVDLFSPT